MPTGASRPSGDSAHTPALARLCAAVTAVLDGPEGKDGDRSVTDALRPVLAAALADPDLLPGPVAGDRPQSGFGKHLLHGDDRFTLFATITAPHNSLPIHDHGSWGVVGVYQGVEEEVRYDPSSQVLPGEPLLVEAGRVLHGPGDVMAVYPPPSDIHAVANAGTEWSVCLHLFAEDPLAQGFNLYLPPDYAPQATGPLSYDPPPAPGSRP